MANYIQALTTIEKKEDAERVSKILLERRLAGYIQIVRPGIKLILVEREDGGSPGMAMHN